MHVFKKYTNPIDKKKQHSNLGQSNSSPIMRILISAVDVCILNWWDPPVNCSPSTLKSFLVTNLFQIHARHRMIEALRRDYYYYYYFEWRATKCALVSWSLAQ